MALVSLPHTLVAGTPENVNHVQANDEALRDGVNNIEDANIGTPLTAASILDGTLTDTELASPNNAVYTTLDTGYGIFIAGTAAFTYWLSASGTPGTLNNAQSVKVLHITAADYAVAGKTTRLNLKTVLEVNGTAPVADFSVALYPITAVGGAAGGLSHTIGANVAGSVCEFIAPGASSQNQDASGDFALPTDGYYLMAVVISAATAASSYVKLQTTVRMRHT